MGRGEYYLRRIVISLFLIWGVATVLFISFRLLPGDYATLLLQSGASQEQVEALRQQWGLNDPLHVQYVRYLSNLLNGELGRSHVAQMPVWEYVRPHLINSFILVAPAITLAFIFGSLYGAFLGTRNDSLLEKIGIVPPTFIGTTPDFFIGIMLIFIFATHLNLFPTQGMVSLETYQTVGQNASGLDVITTGDFWLHYTLPFVTIILKYLYYPTIVMRGSVVETSGQDFAYFHRIKGLSRTSRFRHMLRHASLPVITLFPSNIVRAISGLVLIEVVFNWPGIGKLLIDSVLARDTPVIQFLFLVIAVWVILGNFVVDILYTVIDPRIGIEGEG